MANLDPLDLASGEVCVARRAMDDIIVTNQRVISGAQQWALEDITCIHGALTIGSRARRDMIPSEIKAREGRISLFILMFWSFGGGLLAAVWFILWMINKAFKVKPVPRLAHQLVVIAGGEKHLVLEDYRRREVKRLGLALAYARRMRFRDLRLAKVQADEAASDASLANKT